MKQITVAAMAAIAMLAASAGLAGCASESSSSSAASGTSSSASAAAASCSNSAIQGQLYAKGMLTVATDKPVYPPWFVNNKPTNGQGYESAVAYAVAAQLGFKPSQVTWAYEPFDSSYAPGPKKFDFDINEISYSTARAQAVTFSDSYYDVQQALQTKQIAALVTDTPTAQFISSSEIPGSVMVAQFPSTGEHYGLLFAKGNPLVTCANKALATLKSNGTLAQLRTKYLKLYTSVPTIKP